jgi:large subunit ribosomal protein L31
MKAEIHPTWYPEATVSCGSCGTTWTVGATVPAIATEICSVCHPFFTGQQRIVDTAGQVERFMRRLQEGQDQRETATETKRKKKAAAAAERRQRRGLEPIALRKARAQKEAKAAAKAREMAEAKKAEEEASPSAAATASEAAPGEGDQA